MKWWKWSADFMCCLNKVWKWCKKIHVLALITPLQMTLSCRRDCFELDILSWIIIILSLWTFHFQNNNCWLFRLICQNFCLQRMYRLVFFSKANISAICFNEYFLLQINISEHKNGPRAVEVNWVDGQLFEVNNVKLIKYLDILDFSEYSVY